MRLLVLAALACLTAAPAAAADSWSAPTDLGPVSDYASLAGVGATPTGGLLVGWTTRTQPAAAGGLPGAISVTADPATNDGERGHLVGVGAAGAGAGRTVFARTVVAGPVAVPDGSGLVLTTQVVGGDDDGNRFVRLRLEHVGSNGNLFGAVTLERRAILSDTSLSVNARGQALAAWAVSTPPAIGKTVTDFDTRYALRAVSVDTAHRAGVTKTLEHSEQFDADYGGQVATAVGADGRAAVAFATAHGTRRQARGVDVFLRAPKRTFGSRLVAGPHEGTTELAATFTRTGRAVVAWGAQDGGEEANMPWRIRAATSTASLRSMRLQTLDPGSAADRPAGTVAVVAGADGRTTVGWSGVVREPKAEQFPVAVASAPDGGTFGAPQVLAPDGAFGGLATAPDGRTLATWTAGGQFPGQDGEQATAALRQPGAAAFAAAEPIAPPDVAGPPRPFFLAGHPAAAWSARPHGVETAQGVAATALIRYAVASGG